MGLFTWSDPVVATWQHYFMDAQISSKEFYALVTQLVNAQAMPEVTAGITTHKQAGFFSASREYLRVSRKGYTFDICAAPFGKGFFFSCWVMASDAKHLQARTFFQADTEAMFKDCVQQCVLTAIDKISEEKGIKKLSDTERAMQDVRQ
jgi:hypothetical protein